MIYAQNKSGDTEKSVSLDSVVVLSNSKGGNGLRTDNDGLVFLNMNMLNEMPKLMGNADPIRYAQLLPGISTNGDYDAGLHVMGCENSHNIISIDGTPIYGASHMLGMFSIFNASHFRQMRLQKNAAYGASSDRLGAEIDMQSHYAITDSLTGEASVGLISSQGTIRIPTTRRSDLTLSLRGSYINLLFGALLKDEDTRYNYSFYDVNLTYKHIINDRNRLLLNFYMGNDDLKMLENNVQSDVILKWDNIMASAKWIYNNGNTSLSNNLFFTRNTSKGELSISSLSAKTPASINEWGDKFIMSHKSWTYGAELSLYSILPQTPLVKTLFKTTYTPESNDKTLRTSLFVDKRWILSKHIEATTGLRATWYHTEEEDYLHLSPAASIQYKPNDQWDISLGYSLKHQYITQTGLSSLNTPLEFWVSSGTHNIKPQAAHSMTFRTSFTDESKTYTIAIEGYTKWLSNQMEYNGTIYSFISTQYNLESLLMQGKGHNYGTSVVISKHRGWITGWIAYAFNRAMRTYGNEILNGTYPSSHERIHELNGVVTFHLGKRWDLGVTAIFASGTPFTAPKAFYLLNKNLISEYAEYNSNRLKPYFRLDASVNYRLKQTRLFHEQGINLSIYNLTANKNDTFYYLSFNESSFAYKRTTFFMQIIPSVSYYVKF